MFNTLRRSGYFVSLLRSPERLYQAVEAYFLTLAEARKEYYGGRESSTGEDPELEEAFSGVKDEYVPAISPTVPGLCAYLGADRSLFMKIKSDHPEVKSRYPEDSIYYIRQACILIEDHTIQAALLGKTSAPFAKFLLSAYNDASEKVVTETKNTVNNIMISLASPEAISPGLGEQFRRESERLEGCTSALINKRIDLGEIADKNAENAQSGLDNMASGDVFDVEWENVTEPEEKDNWEDII